MIDDVILIENIEKLFMEMKVVYGPDKKTIELLKDINSEAEYFTSAEENKIGKYYESKEIISLDKVLELSKTRSIILIIPEYEEKIEEIQEQVSRADFGKITLCSDFGLKVAVWANAESVLMPDGYGERVRYLDKVQEELSRAERECEIKQFFDRKWEKPIIIYQIGKVGSSTLKKTFDTYHLPSIQSHSFIATDEGRKIFQKYLEGIKSSSKEKIKVITLVREPIGRSLSHETQLIDRFVLSNETFMNNSSVWNAYNRKIPNTIFIDRGIHFYSRPFQWFDDEIKRNLGIDIFEYPFDKEKGFSMIKKENIELLVLKMEKLNSLTDIIAEFVGVEELVLESENVGSKKRTRYLYKQILNNIKIPKFFIDYYYQNHPRMDFFYSKKEIDHFREKWSANVVDNSSIEISWEKEKILLKDSELIKEEKHLKSGTIILYGASKSGQMMNDFLKSYNIDIFGFADSNIEKCKSYYLDKKVFSIQELKEITDANKELCIIITSVYENEIYEAIEKKGIAANIYSESVVRAVTRMWGKSKVLNE